VQQRAFDPWVVDLGGHQVHVGVPGRRHQEVVEGPRLVADAVGQRGQEPGVQRRRDRVVSDLGRHPRGVDVRGDDVPGGATDDDCPRPSRARR